MFYKDTLIFSALTGEGEEATTEIDCEMEGDPLEVGFDLRRVKNALAAALEKTTLRFEPSKPMVMESEGGNIKMMSLVMPTSL